MFGIIHYGEETPTCGNRSWLATFTDDPEDVTGCSEPPMNRQRTPRKCPRTGSRGAAFVGELDISDSVCAQKENPPDAGSGGSEKKGRG